MQPREPLKERARGRWVGILSAIGVPARALRNKHGPCPVCGGKDRFRFDDKEIGSFYCSQCGPGDGIELVKRLRGIEFREAAKLIEQHLGEAPVTSKAAGSARSSDSTREIAAIWSRSRLITSDDAAGRYLQARTGLTEFPASLRFAADERYADFSTKPSWHPMMVANVEPCDAALAAGEHPALHRTYLDGVGGKAQVPSPRKMLGTMPTAAAVRLMPHDEVLGIAEGIETAISASILFGIPVWAALTEGLLQDWVPPETVRTVLIFGDNDPSFAGQAAAYLLARRLKAKGLTATVELPTRSGTDWNDVLQKGKGQ